MQDIGYFLAGHVQVKESADLFSVGLRFGTAFCRFLKNYVSLG